MWGLLIDTTNKYLVLLLLRDNKVVDQHIEVAARQFTDVFRPRLEDLLHRNQLSLPMIKQVYVVLGPGSYTGVRIGLAFTKVLYVLNPQLEVYTINSLRWQVGGTSAVSMLDARSNQYFFAIYNGLETIIPEQVIDYETCMDIAGQFQNLPIIKDYEDIAFAEHFQALQTVFQRVIDVDHLEPLYIKGNY